MKPTLHVEQNGAVTTVTARGKIAGESSLDLLRAVELLVHDGHRRILLDMAEVTYVDSCGLGQLAAAFAAAQDARASMKLVRVTPRARALLHITRLNRVFEIFTTREDAVHSFRSLPVSGCYTEGDPPCWEVV
ncbi:MAG: STAS domain-containing protein [Bryobacterales bacterium]|nr:STAS domain-containing protein [Bryobacterales bacterium]